MAHSKPYPRCIYCGAKANSREHAVPAWIAKRLGVRDFLEARTALTHQVAPRKQPISFARHRARIFCANCNTHFKHLEDAVIPLLVPMAKGRVLSLGHDHQALLAVWAAKTAAALIAATSPELREAIPAEHRHCVREDGRPFAECWIGFFPWQGNALIAGGTATAEAADGVSYDAYVSVLAFAKIGFVVTGFMRPLSPIDVLDGDKSSLIRFWPPRAGLVDWPPMGPPLRPGDDLATLLSTAPMRRRGAA
jgi:hypothetical protein